MKRFFLFLSFAVFVCVSCVDDSYDLSTVDTDNISIGENESFEMPLATVTIRMDEFKKESVDLTALMNEADTWLPSTLPGSADYVDLQKVLHNDAEYINALLNALMDEMCGNPDKMNLVVNTIWSNKAYRNEFSSELPTGDDKQQAFKDGFKRLFASTQQLRDLTAARAKKYLSELKVEAVEYRLDKIDISNDVVKMLTDNLDDRNTPNGTRRLELYGSVTSALPLSLDCAPLFLTSPVVEVSTIRVEPSQEMTIDPTRIYADDLRHILAGATISFPVELLKYYPQRGYDRQQEIRLTLKLRKTGGLKIDL